MAHPPLPDLGSFAGRAVAVMGLGISGLSAATRLAEAGALVTCWDDGEAARTKAEAAGLRVADLGTAVLSGFDAIIWSPGIPHTHPAPHPVAQAAKAAGTPQICDIELLLRARPDAPYIGITGTNGKSTTTALTTHLLGQAGINALSGGNIGKAALDMAAQRGTVHVMELSSYQIELTHSRAFTTAALTNITPDHLDRHGGMDGYTAAKRRLFTQLQPEGACAVIGVDCAPGQSLATDLAKRERHLVLPVSVTRALDHGVYVDAAGTLIDALDGTKRDICTLADCPALPGRHNWQNAAIAYACARMEGVSADALIPGFGSFGGLPHRQQIVGMVDGVTYVNDSKATNAEAAGKALASYDKLVWIVGGQAKETGLDGLEYLADRIAHAVVIGEDRAVFSQWLSANNVPHEEARVLADALPRARQAAQDTGTKTILLSPAAASWDQYPNFEARGADFAQQVSQLQSKEPA